MSSKYDAIDAVCFHLYEIPEALELLRCRMYSPDAAILLNSMMTYIFTIYLFFSKLVLIEINDTQNILQTPGQGLDAFAAKLGAIVLFFQNELDNIERRRKSRPWDFCKQMGMSTERRIRRKKRMPVEDTMDTGISLTQD